MEAKVSQMINDKRKVLGRGLDSLLPGKPLGHTNYSTGNAAPQEIGVI